MRAHYATFAAEVRGLPPFVKEEFEAYFDCGILAKGFLRLSCDTCARDTLVAFSCKRRGLCPSCGTLHMTCAQLLKRVYEIEVERWACGGQLKLIALIEEAR